jgi:hypothetical protein
VDLGIDDRHRRISSLKESSVSQQVARAKASARCGRRLSHALGLEVTVDHRGDGGTLHIKYKDLDQLDAVLKKLGGG